MSESAKNSILIVDDEPQDILFLNHVLGENYQVYAAKDGAEGIEKARKIRPDLILLDIVLPGISGYQVLRELKTSFETKDIPVIIITGLESVEDLDYTLENGAADFIPKPFGELIVKKRVGHQIAIVNLTRTARGQPDTGHD